MITKKNLSVLFMLLIFAACVDKKKHANTPEKIEIPDVKLELKISRFEKEIFEHKAQFIAADIGNFRKSYGKFFDLWCYKLAGIIAPSKEQPTDAEIATNLNQYIADKYIRIVYTDCEYKFENIEPLKKSLTEAFKRYSILFPGKNIPSIITYISPFTSNVMAMDSTLGIGLHFYLGADYKYYPSLQLPQYMVRKFREEYMLTDMMKGWIDSEYASDSLHNSFLNQIIYQGKILYSLDVLTPDADDSIKTGYTANQVKWAYENESLIWGFFLEHQMLYATNPKNYMKFINDGNGTNGFPKEAPAQLGVFIGWQIVRSFMHQHPDMKLTELFKIQDAQLLLSQSSYKPAKPS